jgi:threonine/homoserine/homoserine lactone efflux protein
MEATLSGQVSIVIFALIVVAVGVYVVMSCYVVGPVARLMRAEKIILGVGLAGIGGVLVYAATELLFHVVF